MKRKKYNIEVKKVNEDDANMALIDQIAEDDRIMTPVKINSEMQIMKFYLPLKLRVKM